MITVCLLAYNRPNYLGFAIESILAQTFVDFELLIIDNGSNIDTQKVIANYSDSRIRVLRFAENDINNINYPFLNPTRDYFMVMHDDDLMEKEFLTQVLLCLEQGLFDACGSNIEFIDEDNKQLTIYEGFKDEEIFIMGSDPVTEFFNGRMPACPTVVYRKSFFDKTGLKFDLAAGPAMDANLWVEIVKNGGLLAVLNKPLYRYRLHASQDSQLNNGFMDIDLFKFWMGKPDFLTINNHNRIFSESLRRYIQSDDIQLKKKWDEVLNYNLEKRFVLNNYISYRKLVKNDIFFIFLSKILNKLNS